MVKKRIRWLITQEFKNMLPAEFLAEYNVKSILGSATQELQNENLKHISTVFQTVSYTHFIHAAN